MDNHPKDNIGVLKKLVHIKRHEQFKKEVDLLVQHGYVVSYTVDIPKKMLEIEERSRAKKKSEEKTESEKEKGREKKKGDKGNISNYYLGHKSIGADFLANFRKAYRKELKEAKAAEKLQNEQISVVEEAKQQYSIEYQEALKRMEEKLSIMQGTLDSINKLHDADGKLMLQTLERLEKLEKLVYQHIIAGKESDNEKKPPPPEELPGKDENP
ncbi:MAG TPA: hypothetical protein VF974_07040 [Patescibacteria group bacterium]